MHFEVPLTDTKWYFKIFIFFENDKNSFEHQTSDKLNLNQ